MTAVSLIHPEAALRAALAPAARPLSPSSVSKWLQCSAAWWFHYGLELPEPATAALALGSAIHRTAAAIHRAIGAHAPISAEDVEEIARALAAEEIDAAELKPEENSAALIAQAAQMAEAYRVYASGPGRPEPLLVEHDLRGEIGGVSVRGIADLITVDACVTDLKTASRKPAGIAASHRFQLTTYAMLSGLDSARVITITKTAAPYVLSHTTAIDNSDRVLAENLYSLVRDASAQGFYVPNRGALYCSRSQCAHWRVCENEYGGTVAK